MLFFYIILFSFQLSDGRNLTYLPDVFCQPYIHYVPITETYEHQPYVIKLYRCHGKTDTRQLTKCIPKTLEGLEIYTINNNGQLGNTTVVNHTSCHEKCVHNSSSCNKYQTWNEARCGCSCNQNTPPADCVSPFVWYASSCSCRCKYTASSYPCSRWKKFSENACGCVCKPKWGKKCALQNKYLNASTCDCGADITKTAKVESPNCLKDKGKIVIGLVVSIEAVVILLLFYLWNQYYDLIKRYCCCRKAKTITFEDIGNNNAVTNDTEDGSIAETPTIDVQPYDDAPIVSQESCDGGVKSPNERPFIFANSLSRQNKYRYEMANIVPIFYDNNERSIYPENRTLNGNTVCYNDVKEVSNDTFSRSASLASVTQV